MTTPLTRIRGSSAGTAMQCNGSLVPTDFPYNPQSDEARAGTAKHVALAAMVRGEDPPIVQIAEHYQVDADEIAKAVAAGRTIWAEVGKWYPQAKTEQRIEGLVTCGTADVLSVGDGTLAVLDWKTGWGRNDHDDQLMAYADAARYQHTMPASGYITAIEAWTAHRETITRNFTADELDGFRARADDQLAHAGSQYSAGRWCDYCAHQNHCPARDEYLRASVVALTDEPTAMTAETLGSLYDRAKMLRSALARYDRLLDDELAKGRPVPMGGGKIITLEVQEQDEILPIEAQNVLTSEGFTSDDITEIMKVPKAAIERVLKGKVDKGAAAGAMRQVMAALREAGAVGKKIVEKKTVKDEEQQP
jgi:hypothetical protein